MTAPRSPEPAITSDERELRQLLIGELFGELRAYRAKEFQVFLFSFPMVGAGLLPTFRGSLGMTTALTILVVIMLHYVWSNHHRMMGIKSELRAQYVALGLDTLQRHLRIREWASKPWYGHLGTVLFSATLIAELAWVWVYPLLVEGSCCR